MKIDPEFVQMCKTFNPKILGISSAGFGIMPLKESNL